MKKTIALLLAACALLAGCGGAPKPDRDAFLAMLKGSNMTTWLIEEVASAEGYRERPAMYTVLTDLRAWYEDENGIPPRMDGDSRYFSYDELADISNDLLGYAYPVIDLEDTRNNPQMIFGVKYDREDDSWRGVPDPASYQYKDGHLTVEADIAFLQAGVQHTWRMRYTFLYMPENKYIPYRLVSAEYARPPDPPF